MKKCLVVIMSFVSCLLVAQTRQQTIIDADTANEVDDLYAIVRAFAHTDWDITALSAAQWQASQWSTERTMEDSHRLNSLLLGYLQPDKEVKLLRGGADRMYDWGDQARHSAAAYEIIKQANAKKGNSKLIVISLGALTNVASALLIDPSIASRIEVYWLGTSFDFETNQSKRLDFNPVMDIQAVEVLLTRQVSIHIMPINVAAGIEVDYQETKQALEGRHDLTDFLIQRWYEHVDGGRKTRTLWDVALIEAMIHPEWTEQVKVTAFENKNVWMYKSFDREKFVKDLYESIVMLADQL